MTHVCVSGGRKGEVEEEEGVGKKMESGKQRERPQSQKKKEASLQQKKEGSKRQYLSYFFNSPSEETEKTAWQSILLQKEKEKKPRKTALPEEKQKKVLIK